MIFNSIRWRLQMWHGLLLTVIVSGFGVTAYQLQYAQHLRRIDDELEKRSTLLTVAFRPEPREGGPLSGRNGPPPLPPGGFAENDFQRRPPAQPPGENRWKNSE